MIKMAVDYKVMGQRIKSARTAKNMTQEELAEKLNLSVAFLSRVERGSSHVNLQRLAQLGEALDVPESYFLDGISSNSKVYLDEEFQSLLNSCTPEKKKLIYNVAKTIAETDLDSVNN